MKNAIFYIKDLMTAIWARLTAHTVSTENLERRMRFIDDAVTEKAKSRFPYRIIKSAYTRQITKNKQRDGEV